MLNAPFVLFRRRNLTVLPLRSEHRFGHPGHLSGNHRIFRQSFRQFPCVTALEEERIQRQLRQVEEMRRLEARVLPQDIDYLSIHGLRMEARQKLQDIRPHNLGQASRVSGVSPADVAVLMIYLKQAESAHREQEAPNS